ncbi:MAG: ATP-binding protein [Acidobacteriota bacterium]
MSPDAADAPEGGISSMRLCAEDLSSVDIFGDLEADQLEWVLDYAECLDLEDGEVLWREGQVADAMFVVLSGRVQLLFELMGQTTRVTSDRWGGVIGLLPYSRMETWRGKALALGPTRALRIDRRHFADVLHKIPELGYRLVALMSDRVREGTRLEQQREKMMALGKLSAGLAHELNNPAAAVARAASNLSDGLARSNGRIVDLVRLGLDADAVGRLVDLRSAASGAAAPGEEKAPAPALSPIERGEREDELADWLEESGAEDGFLLAEAFVDAGLDADDLRAACAGIPHDAVRAAAEWVAGGLEASQLLSEVRTAAQRISTLVQSVKSYSHMDQTPEKTPSDVHLGLDETLTMLGYPLRKKSVRVEKRYAADLPPVPVFPSDINQVWTNLIDNAIDALDEGGLIAIETEHDSCSAFIRIIDDGAGIPEEVRDHLFEPFVTSKGVGEGTGLGLDIAQRIVLQHRGQIDFESEPGRTVFTVRLPLVAA